MKLKQHDYKLDTKSPHVAACLLKDWLRGLKASLIPQTHYNVAIDMAKNNEVKQESLDAFLWTLPRVNRETIKYLAKFLQELVEDKNVQETQMNLESVAHVFAPTMMECPHNHSHNDPKILLANIRWERIFIIGLIQEYKPSGSRIPRSWTCPNLHL